MSRIEQALEKSSKLRERQGEVHPPLPVAPVLGTDPDMSRLQTDCPVQVDNPLLAALDENYTTVSEEYSKLRAMIVKLTKGETFKNTLMVSSTVSGEGKTLTALNLAIALAREYDHTVLLVDTDLRRPSVHTYLELEPEFGLIQCVKEGIPLDRALIKTGIGKLVILPAGGTLPDPVEFLSSNRFKDLVSELKTRYLDRYVIFDTPPMLPYADAQVLNDSVDSSLFVVREKMVKLQPAKKIIEGLRKTNLLGVVYNDAQSSSANSPYSYY
ncbi:MAG: polysaccharide biosynthesis protein [Desulfuromonas sp.]|nr:MAG: polysaccharide biosynthesis protein [Desulfuromonas sp.]